eukprot:m.13972 g.13972  ORF g.13972 m.13972 type:complete len:107 (+) comp10263_c0_seq1:293-613(+)
MGTTLIVSGCEMGRYSPAFRRLYESMMRLVHIPRPSSLQRHGCIRYVLFVFTEPDTYPIPRVAKNASTINAMDQTPSSLMSYDASVVYLYAFAISNDNVHDSTICR